MTATVDPLQKYRIKKSVPEPKSLLATESETPKVEEPSQKVSKDPLEKYRPTSFPEETFIEEAFRDAAQYGMRIVERAAGAPEDIKQFVGDLIVSSYENAAIGLTGGEKQREAPEFLKTLVGQQTPQVRQRALKEGLAQPSSQEFREIGKKATKGYTEPRGPNEERIGNVLGDITSTFLTPAKAKPGLYNNLIVPVGANVAEHALETLGVDEKKKAYGKMGTWFMLGLAGNVNANQFARNFREEVNNSLPANSPANLNKFGQELAPLDRKFLAGDPRTSSASKQINDIRSDVKNGKVSVDDLMNRVSAINAEIDLKGGFDYKMNIPKHVRDAEIRNLNKVKGAVYNTIEESTKSLPGFFNKYMESQNIFRAIGVSNKMMEFAKKHYGKIASGGLASLFGGAHLGGVGGAALAGSSIGTIAALSKAGQVMTRIYKNKSLRDYYMKATAAVVDDNKVAFIQNMQKLDKALAEEEQKKKKIPFKQ